MLKHGISLCLTGSSVLHVLVLILITRAVTVSQVHMSTMEAFIIAPSSVSECVTRQPMHHAAKVTRERRGLETKQTLSGQEQTASISAPDYEMHPDSSRKSVITTIEPVPSAHGSTETGKAMNTDPGASATSHFLRESAESQSTATSPHGTETRGEMSLGDAGAPRFIHRELPIYPFLARKLGKEGNVVLRLTLDERGRQKDIEIIVKAGFGFTDAALQAVKRSIFSPAQREGKPVASRVLIPVKFVLREN